MLPVSSAHTNGKIRSRKCALNVFLTLLIFSNLAQFQIFVNGEPEKVQSNGESVSKTPVPVTPSASSPSLFDSLPFNGALVIDQDNIPILTKNSLHNGKRVRIKVRNPSRFNSSTVSSTNTSAKNTRENYAGQSSTIKQIADKQLSPVSSSPSSLFDLLPNQGAMTDTTTTTTASESSSNHDQGNINPNPRNQRSPLSVKHKRFDASLSGAFEIEPQKPNSDFSLSFFNANVLPPIIKSLTQDDNPEIQRLTPPTELKLRGGYSSGPASPPTSSTFYQYQPPPRQIFVRQPYGPPQHNTNYKVVTTAVRVPSSPTPAPAEHQQTHYKKPNVGAAASSGGSTVIIYANPQSPQQTPSSSPASNNEVIGPPAPPIRNSYGVPSTTTAAPAKNEIHYHYHINSNNDDKVKNPPAPSTVYGKPAGPLSPPPPRGGYYKPPMRNRNPPYGNTYLPPPKNNAGGYPATKAEQPQGGYSSSTGSQGQAGGYSSSSSSSSSSNSNSNSNGQQEFYPNNQSPNNNQQIVPIIQGGKSARREKNFDLLSIDYDNNNNRNNDDYDDHLDADEKFRSRTLFTIQREPSSSQQPPPPPSTSYGQVPPLSNTYGPPPPLPPPSNSYGPPAPPPPPSTPAPPPPINDNPSQTQSAQTSITLETIPITTTETRFVTVPKITQTLGGSLQQNFGNSPPSPNDTPQGGYGGGSFSSGSSSSSSSSAVEPPAAPNRNINNLLSQNQRNILNEQLLQLSPGPGPGRGGLPDFSDIELLAFLQGQNAQRNFHQSNSNGHLLSELLNGNLNGGNFRGLNSHLNSHSLFANGHQSGADLRTLSLLNAPVVVGSNLRGGGGNYGNYGPAPATPFSSGFGGAANSNVPILTTGSPLHSLRGGGTVLTGDAVGAISDLIREQRLQLAVSDLRNRLRSQHREADRSRASYRSLFYKGALLLAGLSLIPTVTTVVSPGLAAAAAVGAGTSASASTAFSLSSSLLPLTTGRRRRREATVPLEDDHDQDGDGSFPSFDMNLPLSMERRPRRMLIEQEKVGRQGGESCRKCTLNISNNTHNSMTTVASHVEKVDPFPIRIENARKIIMGKVKSNYDQKKGQSLKQKSKSKGAESLFDTMAFKGALIPEKVRKDLERYLPPEEIMKNSQCVQKYFCQNLLQIEALPDPMPILLLYAGLSSDVDTNPWLREAMTAARNKNCSAFYCHVSMKQQYAAEMKTSKTEIIKPNSKLDQI